MDKDLRNGMITVAIGVILWFLPVPTGLKPQAWHLLSIFVATIIGFILQPLPIGAVAFIALSIAGLTKTLTPAEALNGFGQSIMWLIISAFLFALGFIKTGLGKRIAYRIMGAIGDS